MTRCSSAVSLNDAGVRIDLEHERYSRRERASWHEGNWSARVGCVSRGSLQRNVSTYTIEKTVTGKKRLPVKKVPK